MAYPSFILTDDRRRAAAKSLRLFLAQRCKVDIKHTDANAAIAAIFGFNEHSLAVAIDKEQLAEKVQIKRGRKTSTQKEEIVKPNFTRLISNRPRWEGEYVRFDMSVGQDVQICRASLELLEDLEQAESLDEQGAMAAFEKHRIWIEDIAAKKYVSGNFTPIDYSLSVIIVKSEDNID